MKKKILVLCLVVALAVTAVVGGTLAYFTDKDAATNTFTAGGVTINLIEQERGANGLQEFTQDQVLMPIVGSAQGEKDEFGQPVAENYIDKMVTIKNTGKSDAYVRAYFAIPSALDDGFEESFNASMNILHFNFGNVKTDNGLVSTEGVQWIWTHGNTWNYFETTIDNVKYNVYYADYYKVLPAGATTEQFISGVYLDNHVDMKDGKYIDTRFPTADLSILAGKVNCPVYAVAVQADGFETVDEAVTAAFGANFNPFGGTATNWQ